MKKTIFIIPGYRQLPQQSAYKQIAKMLKNEGYYPIPVHISWNKRTLSENTEYFLRKYKSVKRKHKYIFGFSFGAMIAFLAATQVNVTGLILCSLSPYFREDLPKNVRNKTKIRNTMLRELTQFRFKRLAKQIKTKQILFLYGGREANSLIKRVTLAFDKISASDKYLMPIKNTSHNISDKRYLSKINQAAKLLN